jgi:hypothetical protein
MMPVRPERKHLYPANWKSEIVPAVRKRSGNRCEKCGVRHGQLIARTTDGRGFIHIGMAFFPSSPVIDADTGMATGQYAADVQLQPVIKIILTVAHLNHDEADCRMENLAHWCQLHHNRLDAKHRAIGVKARKAMREVPA